MAHTRPRAGLCLPSAFFVNLAPDLLPDFHQFPLLRALWAPEFPPPYVRLESSCVGGGIIKPDRILVIERDEALAVKATAALEEAGFEVVRAADTLDGLRKLYEAYPDLIIVDSELPTVQGQEPCLRIRQSSCLPIIVLSGQEEAAEMIELGADTYMTKPLSLSELVARVRALLRRKPRCHPPGHRPGLEIAGHLPKGGNGLNGLTPTEFRLASYLILNEGRLLSHSRLISEVWGGKKVSTDTLHFYMRRLRQKLANGSIFMLRGVGYCFSGSERSSAVNN